MKKFALFISMIAISSSSFSAQSSVNVSSIKAEIQKSLQEIKAKDELGISSSRNTIRSILKKYGYVLEKNFTGGGGGGSTFLDENGFVTDIESDVKHEVFCPKDHPQNDTSNCLILETQKSTHTQISIN